MKKLLIALIFTLACINSFAQISIGGQFVHHSRNSSILITVPPVYIYQQPQIVYVQPPPQIIYQQPPVVIFQSQAPFYDAYFHGYCAPYHNNVYAQCIEQARRRDFEQANRYYR